VSWDVFLTDEQGTRIGEVVDHSGISWTTKARGIGTWSITLEADHPAALQLNRPMRGLMLEHRVTGELLTGRWTTRSAKTIEGRTTIVFAGPDDVALLDRAVLEPAAGNTHVVASGPLETAAKLLVAATLPGFDVADLSVAPTQGRGPDTPAECRFTPLLEQLLKMLGPDQWVLRCADNLVDITPPGVSAVRLSVRDGNIASIDITETAPTLTRVLVGGQGEGVARQIIEVLAPTEISDWGTSTRFRDRRDTADVDVLATAGREALTEGAAKRSIAVTPVDTPSGPQYSIDWRVGDLVLVELVDDEWTQEQVTEVTLTIGSTGVLVAPRIGTAPGVDLQGLLTGLFARIDALTGRLGQLERR
jgi:hypothetical protein